MNRRYTQGTGLLIVGHGLRALRRIFGRIALSLHTLAMNCRYRHHGEGPQKAFTGPLLKDTRLNIGTAAAHSARLIPCIVL